MRNHKIQRNVVKILALTVVCAFGIPMACYAAATNEIVSKINNIYSLVLAIISAIGMIALVWGIFDFATAWQQHDSSQLTQGMRKIVAGLLMVCAGTVIGLLT